MLGDEIKRPPRRPKSRDDFPVAVKQKLAARVAHLCSNPDCRATTSGPQLEEDQALNVGVAAHYRRRPRAARGTMGSLSGTQRAGIGNGIWLCQTCAKLVDSDRSRYTIPLLKQWKQGAEKEAHSRIGKAKARPSAAIPAGRRIKQELQLRDRLQNDLLKSPDERRHQQSVHPYDKFVYRGAVIHRADNDCYPEVDTRPGISSWFTLGFFDLYYAGIVFSLSIEHGIIDAQSRWAVIPYKAKFDTARFAPIKIFRLGKIPYKNILHYDPKGDEYYPGPHLYCAFADNGMPYEAFDYAVVGKDQYKDEYDWPLFPEKHLPDEAWQQE